MRLGTPELAAAVEGRPGWSVRDDGTAVFEPPGADWHGLVMPTSRGAYRRWHAAIVEAETARATHLAWDAAEARDWVEAHP